MIYFDVITWKNLLSYGNNTTTFTFKEGIFNISALNGSGKSTLIEAFYFALFGKPYRKIKLGQLINTKNKKGLEVTLTFKKQDDVYRIERGLKPDYFKIYKNDEIVPVSSSKRGYQQILEEDILGSYNENLCNQVTIKSLTKNISFMTLAKADKRSVIENLFDIELFTSINKNVKKKVDELEGLLVSTKKDIDNTSLLIEQELANIENLRNIQKKLKEESETMIQNYTNEISEIKKSEPKYIKALELIEKNKIKKKEKMDVFTKLNEQKTSLIVKKAESESIVDSHKSRMELLKDTCGECPKIEQLMQADDIQKHHSVIANSEQQISDIKKGINDVQLEIKKIDEILSNERFVNTTIEQNKQRKFKLLDQIKIIKEKVITVDESKLNSYNVKIKEYKNKYNELSNEKKHMQVLRSLFSDDGIKPLIINKYLPTINKLLNTYLMKFNANMIFNFDKDFEEVILSRHQESYSYFSFSEGEKKRIDLSVLFAFIKFAMSRNKKSNTNILFFDEVLSGLDLAGSNALFEVLKEHKDFQNKCIITINHNADIDDNYFDGTYTVVKEKGFSKIIQG